MLGDVACVEQREQPSKGGRWLFLARPTVTPWCGLPPCRPPSCQAARPRQRRHLPGDRARHLPRRVESLGRQACLGMLLAPSHPVSPVVVPYNEVYPWLTGPDTLGRWFRPLTLPLSMSRSFPLYLFPTPSKSSPKPSNPQPSVSAPSHSVSTY